MGLQQRFAETLETLDDRLPKNCTREHTAILIAKTVRRYLSIVTVGIWLLLGFPGVASLLPLGIAEPAFRMFLWGLVIALLLTAAVLSCQAIVIYSRFEIHRMEAR
jgi:hypothetical protein